MNQGKRITLLRAGKRKRKFVLVEPPFPETGESVQLDGEAWIVIGIEDASFQIIPLYGRALEEPQP